MGQLETINKVTCPSTIQSLQRDLKALGVQAGMDLIVHSSLKSIGWISGSAHAVVLALMETVSQEGTLVMPTHSPSLSEPSYWVNPPIPESWWTKVRETMPAFDPLVTPSECMGVIPEVFRSFPHTVRSYHPSASFTAWGKKSLSFTGSHSLNDSFSDSSPLGALYRSEAAILLIGVGHESNTSLHLAESRIPSFPKEKQGGPILFEGNRIWQEFEDYEYDSDDFSKLGEEFESKEKIQIGLLGSAQAKLIPMKAIVDFATEWIPKNRNIK